MSNELSEISHKMVAKDYEIESLTEQLNDYARRLNDADWQLLDSFDDDTGISLENLKQISDKISDMTASGSLLKRGAQLRYGYVFGRGMLFGGVPPRVRTAMEHPYNEQAMFTQKAWEELMLAHYTDGNLFLIRNVNTNILTRVPLSQVTGLMIDPDSTERIWFVQRTWTVGNNTRKVWYPLDTYDGPVRRTIEDVAVDNKHVMYHDAVNRQIGWALGVPDALAAMTWAAAYSEYIKNNATLVRAYSQLAFKFTQTTKAGVNAAAATLRTGPGVGGTAGMAAGTDLVALPANGSQVNFGNGRPIASLVAASLGVSVVALLADPGAAGSSYGAAQTLDSPTVRVMSAIQDSWIALFRRVLKDMGANPKKLEVTFPAIETDVPYRQLTSLATAYTTGALHQEEYRAAVMALLDIPDAKPVAELPVPDNFNTGHVVAGEEEEEEEDPLSRQGNQGAVPGGSSPAGNDARDNGEYDN